MEFLVTDKAPTRQWSDLCSIIKSQVLRFRQNILFHDNWRCFKGRDKVLLANSMFTKYHWRHFQGGNAQKDWQRGQEKLSYKIGQVLLWSDWDTTGPHHPRAGRCPGPPWCPARSSAATGGPWWPEERVHLVERDSVNKEYKHNWTPTSGGTRAGMATNSRLGSPISFLDRFEVIKDI